MLRALCAAGMRSAGHATLGVSMAALTVLSAELLHTQVAHHLELANVRG